MYYPCSENKGADQLRGYREADLRLCFRIGKIPVFSQCGSNDDSECRYIKLLCHRYSCLRGITMYRNRKDVGTLKHPKTSLGRSDMDQD